jgi:hypothetical protein
MNSQEKILSLQVQKLQKKITTMRELSNCEGFYKAYFKDLTKHKNGRECFQAINERYYELFECYRFSDYESFKTQLSKFNNKKK